MLYVTAPERSGTEHCGRILHISCGIRQNAGRLETYVINFPVEPLKKAGVSIPGAPALPSPDPDLDALLSRTPQLTGDQPAKTPAAPKPFSVRYKDRQRKFAEARERAGIRERPPRSFDLSVPIRLTEDNAPLAAAELVPDKQQGRFLFKRSAEAAPVSLTFTGVEYVRGVPAAARRLAFVVDLITRSFHISVPSSPMRLELPESSPSALYDFYLQKRRTAQAAETTTPGTVATANTSPGAASAPSGTSL